MPRMLCAVTTFVSEASQAACACISCMVVCTCNCALGFCIMCTHGAEFSVACLVQKFLFEVQIGSRMFVEMKFL